MIKRLPIIILSFLVLTAFTTSAGKDTVGGINIELNLYPNPVQKTLNMDLGLDHIGQVHDMEVKFTDLLGKEVRLPYKSAVNSMSSHYEIDLGDLTPGFYFIEIYLTGPSGTEKITKRITKAN